MRSEEPSQHGISAFQQAILADEIVEFAEYERAVVATMSCLEQEGFETTGPYPSQGGRVLGFDTVVGDELDSEYQDVLAACEAEYLFPLVDVYNASIAPSEQEIEEGDEIVLDCVREHGLDVPDIMSAYEAVMRDLGTLSVCLNRRDAFLYD